MLLSEFLRFPLPNNYFAIAYLICLLDLDQAAHYHFLALKCVAPFPTEHLACYTERKFYVNCSRISRCTLMQLFLADRRNVFLFTAYILVRSIG
jgi:hypothetical protein